MTTFQWLCCNDFIAMTLLFSLLQTKLLFFLTMGYFVQDFYGNESAALATAQ